MKIGTFVLATSLLSGVAAWAQTAPPPGTAGQRKADQQARIAQGVQSGQLTAHETGNLEHREASVNREERNMRAQDNGHLTRSDRSTIQHQQNQESRRIYRDKHNAKVQ